MSLTTIRTNRMDPTIMRIMVAVTGTLVGKKGMGAVVIGGGKLC